MSTNEEALRLIPMGEDLESGDYEEAGRAVRSRGFVVTSDQIFHAVDPFHWSVVTGNEPEKTDLEQGDYYGSEVRLKAVSDAARELLAEIRKDKLENPQTYDSGPDDSLHTMDVYAYVYSKRKDLERDTKFMNEFFGTTVFGH